MQFSRSDLVCPGLTATDAAARLASPAFFLKPRRGFEVRESLSNVPFACISASTKSAPIASISSTMKRGTVEPTTGLSFPDEYCTRGTTDCPKLSGMGPRMKRIAGINIKVYAVGMYIDGKAFKSALANKYKKADASELCKSPAFCRDLVGAQDVEKTLRLVFARDVKGPAIRDALSKALRPKLKNASELVTFEKYFDGLAIKNGQHLSFSSSNGTLTTSVGDKQLGVICSQPLCAALFECYLGADPVSKVAKENITKELAQLLK